MNPVPDKDQPVTGGERARALVAVEVLLRLVRHARDCFPDDDLETVIVYLTVVCASVGAHVRDPELLASLGENDLPEQFIRPTSGRAIAESTGLPRESVRRRIDALVARGWLVRDGRGVRSVEGTMHVGKNRAFSQALIQELSAAPGKLARFDGL